jgi:hypothetical protein
VSSHEIAPWQLEAAIEDVDDSRPAARWSVEESVWQDLPDDMIALLAEPVVVSAG